MENKIEGKKVMKNDNVTIVYTEKSRFHKAGEEAVLHRLAAEKLVAKGFAKLKK